MSRVHGRCGIWDHHWLVRSRRSFDWSEGGWTTIVPVRCIQGLFSVDAVSVWFDLWSRSSLCQLRCAYTSSRSYIRWHNDRRGDDGKGNRAAVESFRPQRPRASYDSPPDDSHSQLASAARLSRRPYGHDAGQAAENAVFLEWMASGRHGRAVHG